MQRLLCALAFLLLPACALSAPGTRTENIITVEPTAVISLEMRCQQKGYDWHIADSRCSYSQDGNPIIEIFYPVELIAYPLIENTIDSYIRDYRANFDSQFAQSGGNSPGAWQLQLHYQIYQHSQHIISVEWIETSYTGGASIGSGFTTFTFDIASGQILSISDLFAEGVDPLNAIMTPVRENLYVQLVEVSSVEQINNGTDELSEYDHFVLSDTALIILFEPYLLAPGAAGFQRVEIPLSTLGNQIKAVFRG